MEKILQPGKLAIDPNSAFATKSWRHWKRIFLSYVNRYITNTTSDDVDNDRLSALISCSTPEVYEYFDHCTTFDEAEKLLDQLYVKKPNDIFARHLLMMEKQKPGQSLEDFRCTLLKLAKDCEFRDTTAIQYKDDMVRDSFINGIISSEIRQRLLEHKKLTLTEAFQQAITLDNAKRDNRIFECKNPESIPNATNAVQIVEGESSNMQEVTAAIMRKNVCNKCGSQKPHDYRNCKAKNQTCYKCGTKGHYARACNLQKKGFSQKDQKPNGCNMVVAEEANVLCALEEEKALERANSALVEAEIDGKLFKALLDTGSSKNFISEAMAMLFEVKQVSNIFNVGMAQSTNICNVTGVCQLNLKLLGREYFSIELFVMKNLCVDILLGRSFLELHKEVVFELGGKENALLVSPSIKFCAVASSKIDSPSLFSNLIDGWKPIATKSRRFNEQEKSYIATKVNEWKRAGTVRVSKSPWRAQCVIVKQNGNYSRLAIDYSQTINLFTEKDGFPIPLIEEIVNKIASFKFYASYDLKRAYHQIPIPEKDKPFTAFEACGELLEFNVIPFGVTNGGPVFQRIMKKIIDKEQLKNTWVYFDNIIVGAQSMKELQVQAEQFRSAMKRRGMTLNDEKTIYGVKELDILGYRVTYNQIQPDPERLKPLLDLPPPSSGKSLQRALGFFAYYAKWIPKFSDKVGRLKSVTKFPLGENELSDFKSLKNAIASATLQAIDEAIPFTVECDASDIAVSATLNQNGRPVAFMSRSLQGSELAYPAVEKEATAIIEAVRKWAHLLMRQHFYLVTDQRSVAFMLDSRKKTKIKNNKIMCWRLELSSFSYSIRYRPGSQNCGPDTLTRVLCAAISRSGSELEALHKELCCPGVTRFWHFVRSKNLPYSLEDIKKCCDKCGVCALVKPRFFSPGSNTLIKATQPMERWNIDFKGPLPSKSKNVYFLCIVDEFSRFPFCFPCANVEADTVINCLEKLFSLFGTCGYVHSDRGASLVSKQLKNYLLHKGIATSHTTPYHPQGNAQCERYNGIVWKAVQCALKARNFPTQRWETVLPEALNAIRSLLCTATNQTPHSRFFNYVRRSCHGRGLPEWLCTPGPVLLRKFVRSGKTDDLVQKVDLIEANPMYARVRYADGRESNVSLKDLAKCPTGHESDMRYYPEEELVQLTNAEGAGASGNVDEGSHVRDTMPEPYDIAVDQMVDHHDYSESVAGEEDEGSPRRSQRVNKGVPPVRYGT